MISVWVFLRALVDLQDYLAPPELREERWVNSVYLSTLTQSSHIYS